MKMNRLVLLLLVGMLAIPRLAAQTLTGDEVLTMLNRASALKQEKKYSEAIKVFAEAGKHLKNYSGEHERYAMCQVMICSCYFDLGQYKEGYSLAKSMLAGDFGDDEKELIRSQYVLNGYGLACELLKNAKNNSSDCAAARGLFLEILPYASEQWRQKLLPKVPLTWYFQGIIYNEKLQFNEALACYENALKGFKELGQIANEISVLKHMASVMYFKAHLDESQKKYEQALSLARQINSNREVIEITKELHRLNEMIGNMNGVAYYMNLMDSIVANSTDKNVQFEYYIQKGKEAQKQGRLNIAEQWFVKSIEMVESNSPSSVNGNRFFAYLNMRDLYMVSKQYEKALQYAELTIKESRKLNVSENKGLDLSYSYLPRIYSKIGDKENCFKCLDTLFTQASYIEEPLELNELYEIRGTCHLEFMDYQSALSDYAKADSILATKYSSSNINRIVLCALLGGTEHKLENYEKSEFYYNKYAEGIKAIYGEDNLKYIRAGIYLANAQAFAGHMKQGCDNYTSAIARLKKVLRQRLPYMNAAEREGFWEPLSSLHTNMTPFALKAGLCQTEYTRTCYDALLLSKAFLLDSERSVYEIVQKEGNEADKQTYMQISIINNKIKEWENNYAMYADSILAATNKMNRLEKKLMDRCKSFGDITAFMDVDYDAVKAKLGKNETLLDFTDYFSKENGRRYAVYIVDKQQQFPLLKYVFAESQIDSLGITDAPHLFYDTEDFASEVVKLLWNPIKEHIDEGSTVYYVPSQLLFRVSLESLPLEDGTLLGEHYNFVRLSSARELLKKNKSDKLKNNASAVLYGGLQYDLEPSQMAENSKLYDVSDLMAVRGNSDAVRGNSDFKELAGSGPEVEKVAEILKGSNFKVTPYMGMNGTEESFLNMHGKSPRILHLATHGFYYTPEAAANVDYLRGYSDAMLLSGMIMSGGNAGWKGKELPEGVLDGVLTANSISRLDLSNTDLVVLSACHSGQGNATPEGLYGLQRAFKKAGVGTMIMALWEVNDIVATEFMKMFYENLQKNKWDKRKAFNLTKLQIRTLYPSPDQWAVFVMLD